MTDIQAPDVHPILAFDATVASGRFARRIAVVAATMLALTGCTESGTGAPTDDTTATAAVVRTDPDPLTKRFPKLGDFTDAHWMGGAAGVDSDRVPGPTDVTIQGFVVLRPADLASATPAYAWTPAPAGWDSTVKVELRPHQPAGGDWRQNDQYGSDVRTDAYSGTVYIDLISGTVFLDLISG